jgi:hypothetical protein
MMHGSSFGTVEINHQIIVDRLVGTNFNISSSRDRLEPVDECDALARLEQRSYLAISTVQKIR